MPSNINKGMKKIVNYSLDGGAVKTYRPESLRAMRSNGGI